MINKNLGVIALLASFAGSTLWAGDLDNYSVGDVLVCFQNGGQFDLVVDAGPASNFTTAMNNQVIPLSPYYSTSQFGTAFNNANGVKWSAFTWYNTNSALFVTKARTSLNTQSVPWVAQGVMSQNTTINAMEPVPIGANANTNFNGANTSTAVIEYSDYVDNEEYYPLGYSYTYALNGAYGGEFNGSFQGNPEVTTPNNFTSSGSVVRSDFYELTPGGGTTFLGYFQMATDGSMTYVAYPTATPVIKSITRSGSTATITYTTGTYGTYTLLGTTAGLTTPVSSWTSIATLSTGDTLTHTYTDTDSSPTKFYIIEGQ
jgi:hypothetical protein